MLKKIFKYVLLKRRLRNLLSYGTDVWIGSDCNIQGNVNVGSNVNIGRGTQIISTIANVYIHDYVVIGPEVSIFSGDHAIDILGKHIIEISDTDKKNVCINKYDKDVTVESGCWIGTKAIILKGVTIGRGSIIGAGAVVTKDVPPYSIYIGVPSAKVWPRFTEEQIIEHEKILLERGISTDIPKK